MIRTRPDGATRDGLRAPRRTGGPPKVRDRIEVVALSDAGRAAPRAAAQLGRHPQAARDSLRASAARGTAAPHPPRGGPAPDAGRHDRVATALRQPPGEGRTWAGRRPSEAPAARGIAPGPRRVRRHLERLGAGYRRTASAPGHEQGPAKAERAGGAPADLEARAAAGPIRPYYLGGRGFAPAPPVGASRCLPGPGGLTRYAAPQGRRVNAPAAYRPYGRSPRPGVFTAGRARGPYDLIGFLRALPWSKAPRAVAPGNAGPHTGGVIRQARRSPASSGTSPYSPPPYSPGLSEIGPASRQVRYRGVPERGHTSRTGLREAVERGSGSAGRKPPRKSPERLRPAA